MIGYAVDNGVLSSDATRQVRTVTSTAEKSKVRDHTRAMTRSERDHVIYATLLAAREQGLNPRTRRKRRATADFIAFLAGTGARMRARRVAFGGRTSTLCADASTCEAQRAKHPTAG